MIKKSTVTFDTALPQFAQVLFNGMGLDFIESGVFLRDVSGKLTFIISEEAWSESVDVASEEVARLIPNYVDGPKYAISTPDRLFDEALRARDGATQVELDFGAPGDRNKVWLIERRAAGQDWLKKPVNKAGSVPIIVFASIKGGVGRTTALCVLASHLASTGRRVLALDMDFEAPGLGTMLLTPDTTPKYGLLDYIVETAIGQVDTSFVVDTVGPSWLAAGRGRIDVVPVVGTASMTSPENVLSKIARAYLASSEQLGSGLSETISNFIEVHSLDSRYDVILVDARAGLHETTASAILGLGGEIFVFGVNQPQTLLGYDFLFSHVAARTPKDDEFWGRVNFVEAKSAGAEVNVTFKNAVELLLKQRLFGLKDSSSGEDLEAMGEGFEVDWADEQDAVSNVADEEASDFVDGLSFVSIPESELYRSFDPLLNPDLLQLSTHMQLYGPFVGEVERVLENYGPREI
ncbi:MULTISPECIES: ParA family protein [Stenotrophomonas]|uniref:ParA family protein n=1 Tax=Stenotrophomonas TaxID=40323 RepID=UPI0013DAFE77|nr:MULTISPECIES: ParA family protein [Stenotrophomonas maltophilia group]MBH1360177.1 ParA family protein [Stenotrophomonas maltophilia]MCI1051606.1 ParA family protein [Stenotrophomonas maltophilia]MDT3555507.1 ParA family protein [Stenotrophomonas maltophilia group sp. msm1]